jgi:activator of HSP90 ATPase
MKTVFEQVLLPTTPADVYATYLDPDRHAAVIGAAVEITAEVGEPFEAFDGHVRGRTLRLERDRMIVQTWGSDQMGDGHLIVIALDPVDGGTEVSLLHTGIPDDKLPLVDWPGRYWQPWRALLDATGRVTPEAAGGDQRSPGR